jgi:hypothetical protein
VRPRGWHLDEHRIVVDGKPMSGSLVDFGLHLFHSGQGYVNLEDQPGSFCFHHAQRGLLGRRLLTRDSRRQQQSKQHDQHQPASAQTIHSVLLIKQCHCNSRGDAQTKPIASRGH